MAEYKLYNLKDPKTGQEEPQISSKEEFEAIKSKVPTTNIKNPRTGQEGSAESVVREEITPEDGKNIAMDVAKCLRDALREHGDEIKAVYLSNSTNNGATIRVQYMPDEQGNADEDSFNFNWQSGKLILGGQDELCDLQKQSGKAIVQKDLVKNALLNFLKSHDSISADDTKQPADPNALPDGPVTEEQLWESEECQEAFCKAVYNFQNCPENKKEAIKNLLRAARPYQKGNTIQEKLKGAVEWYNIYKEQPPKNTEKQVFLEDENSWNTFHSAIQSIQEGEKKLKSLLGDDYDPESSSEDIELYKYYKQLTQLLGEMRQYWIDNTSDRSVDENAEQDGVGDMYQNTAEEEDVPVVGEGDEVGPDVGDTVEYEGGNYKFYGYCGYEVVLQNADDPRDFKVVTPEKVGIGSPKADIKETQWVDPDDLPSQDNAEVQRV